MFLTFKMKTRSKKQKKLRQLALDPTSQYQTALDVFDNILEAPSSDPKDIFKARAYVQAMFRQSIDGKTYNAVTQEWESPPTKKILEKNRSRPTPPDQVYDKYLCLLGKSMTKSKQKKREATCNT